MQNIHVRRYDNPGLYLGWIEPEDRSWIVFMDKNGQATFWRQFENIGSDGKVEHVYVDAELPTGLFTPDQLTTPDPDETDPEPGSLTYKVVPVGKASEVEFSHTEEEGGDNRFKPHPKTGFFAVLDQRQIACWGKTKHEATTALINFVAKLCVAGCLDHTGLSKPGGNPRRYEAAFGKS